RRAKPHGLVRPYVLSPGEHAPRRPTQEAADQRLTRGDRPAPDWTGDLSSRRPREAWSTLTRHDRPTTPGTATAPLPAGKSTGSHRGRPGGRRPLAWPGLLAGRRWLVAIGGGVVVVAIAAGMAIYLSQPPTKLLASACGAGGCRQGVARTAGGAKPPGGAPASTHKAV